ncbi:MAG: Holliday junction branch migration protein RuvA [Actinomycetota bacterium]|nr:Holliday junction branch migration protein RuvA [Actinomycetota bacterium]MDQ6948025.1 Holliday junction branch migration protein RuvA [Actinomycetota bacterium]
MIGSLRGILLDRVIRGDHPSGEALVEVGGVGYRVHLPASALARLGDVGSGVFLHVHTHVREDAIMLYGFPSRDERLCFESLIAAHGVGPSVALALLSIHSPAALRRAVAADDAAALTLVPGVGAKTASRLLIELKTRLDFDLDRPELVSVGSGNGNGPSHGGRASNPRAEVRVALAGLGYGADEVRDAVGRLPDDRPLEELLRSALRHLAGNR